MKSTFLTAAPAVVQVVGVGLVVAGVAMVFVPAALMIAGAALIFAVERQ